MGAVGRQRGVGAQRRGVGADVILGERKGRDRALRQTGEILLLLRRRAEQLERRGDADGLRRGEQGSEVAVLAGHQPDRVGVAVLAQAEAAVLGRDLDAERADVAQALHDLSGDLPVPIDLVAVHPLPHEPLEPLHERPGPLQVGRIRLGEGVHQVEPELALEQLAHEAGRLPLLLPRRLGDFPGFLLGREWSVRRRDRGSEKVSHGSRARLRLW